MIISETAFLWFATFMVMSIVIGWCFWDLRLFLRLWKKRKENHDEFFGSIMGLVMVVIGLVGIIRHHLSL